MRLGKEYIEYMHRDEKRKYEAILVERRGFFLQGILHKHAKKLLDDVDIVQFTTIYILILYRRVLGTSLT